MKKEWVADLIHLSTDCTSFPALKFFEPKGAKPRLAATTVAVFELLS
jgi:hypothetical protein